MLALTTASVGYSYRVKVEEQALFEMIDDEYRECMCRTWEFFPGW